MSEYLPTIGLEVHAELKTRTKMFCDSLNDPDEKRPNLNVCPVCLGHPGTLPTINKQAVEHVIRAGLALGGKINPVSKFDRKNYFYPDLPKGYQISQYDEPLVTGGELLGVRLRRVHLEEDTGTLVHHNYDSDYDSDYDNDYDDDDDKKRSGHSHGHSSSYSLVDFNRAGTPLMELVTEPDITSAEQAVAFGKELQLILRYLGASDADMEKGQMRLEANVSVGQMANGKWQMGTKVELKNINSFKALSSAIAYELTRQRELLEKGEKVIQETRGWDDAKQRTVSQRTKEEAHDYRYFPEPDLPPFEPVKIFNAEDMLRHLPELPHAKRERFQREFGLTGQQAALLAETKPLADFFEAAVSELATRDELETAKIEKRPRELLFNYLTSDLAGLLNENGIALHECRINPEQLAHLVDLVADGKIGSRQAKDILRKMLQDGSDPEDILIAEGLHTVRDESALETVVREVIQENPQAVADYKKGKTASMQFLIGKAMAKLRGAGNPEMLRGMFGKELTK